MYEITIPNQRTMAIKTNDDVFFPTYTSALYVQSLCDVLTKSGSLLDLGCGSGILGIAAHAIDKNMCLYASDFSANAVALTAENAVMKNIAIDVRQGSLFEPWDGMTFDYIIDSISGIAQSLARLSPWYTENISCESGEDGTDLTLQILAKGDQYLNNNGILLFPVISLSNTQKVLDFARTHFKVVEKVAFRAWMLPDEMLLHKDKLVQLRESGAINYEEKFGVIVCWSAVYQCHQGLGKKQ